MMKRTWLPVAVLTLGLAKAASAQDVYNGCSKNNLQRPEGGRRERHLAYAIRRRGQRSLPTSFSERPTRGRSSRGTAPACSKTSAFPAVLQLIDGATRSKNARRPPPP